MGDDIGNIKEILPLAKVTAGFYREGKKSIHVEPSIFFEGAEFDAGIENYNNKILELQKSLSGNKMQIELIESKKKKAISLFLIEHGPDGNQEELNKILYKYDKEIEEVHRNEFNKTSIIEALQEQIQEQQRERKAEETSFYELALQKNIELGKQQASELYQESLSYRKYLVKLMEINENLLRSRMKLKTGHEESNKFYVIRDNIQEMVNLINFLHRRLNRIYDLDLSVQNYNDHI